MSDAAGTAYRPVHYIAGVCTALYMKEAMEWAAKNGGATGENIKKGFYQKKDWVPAGMEGVCNASTWTDKDHRGTLKVDLYRMKVAGATERRCNDLDQERHASSSRRSRPSTCRASRNGWAGERIRLPRGQLQHSPVIPPGDWHRTGDDGEVHMTEAAEIDRAPTAARGHRAAARRAQHRGRLRRRHPGAARPQPRRAEGRDRGAARRQRRRQVDHAEGDLRPAQDRGRRSHPRRNPVRRRAHQRHRSRQDRPPRHLPGDGGPPHHRRHDRRSRTCGSAPSPAATTKSMPTSTWSSDISRA